MTFDDQDIIICTECDAEFAVNRFDDDDVTEVQHCPYCGHHLWEEVDGDEEEEDDDGPFFN